MCRVISVANQKGGVAKSTTTLNLGVGLARQGKKVLLIDADPQGSLTASLGYLIVETVMCKSDKVLIASNWYSGALVRGKFMKLDYSHVEYVLHCLEGNTSKIKNIKKYLLAALFNAPSTINGYYRAEVNHDMPWLVR